MSLLRAMGEMQERRCPTDRVKISVLTWNIEHHGFTRNGPNGKRPQNNTSSVHHGYNETQDQFQQRLDNVFEEMKSNGMPGLIGLNEIGVLAFKAIQLRFPSQYTLFASEVSLTGCTSEQEEVYGNVVAVDTTRWGGVTHEHVTFPETKTNRANTAIVTRLGSGDGTELVWIHTHLKWNSQDPERAGQVQTIQQLVKRHAPVPVIVTGDLYLPLNCTALTSDLGLHKVHHEKTQYFDNPGDPDQVLVPGVLKVDEVKLLGDFNKRRTFSDHYGVKAILTFEE